MDVRGLGVRINKVPKEKNSFIYYLKILDKLPSSVIGFSHREDSGIIEISTGDSETLILVIFCYGLNASKVFFIYRGLINSGKRL